MNIVYCANGCSKVTSGGSKEQTTAVSPGRLCRACRNRLEKWLEEIPERHRMLPQYLTPSADLDANPESKATKRPTAPVPVRLGALDLMDTRRGRKWNGLVPTTDRRGALGSLLAIANEVRALRGGKPLTNSTVKREAGTIASGLDLLTQSPGITDTYTEIRTLHRDLGDAVGQYPPSPVGTCFLTTDDKPESCGGPLLPVHTGVLCPRCGAKWGHDQLRRLGMALKEGA